MKTIQIHTFLPALRAAELGLSQHGDGVATPTDEEWRITPPALRVYLAEHYLGCASSSYQKHLTVAAPGWEAVLTAGEQERQKAEQEAAEKAAREAAAQAAREAMVNSVLTLNTIEEIDRIGWEVRRDERVLAHREKVRSHELFAAGSYRAYLSTEGLKNAPVDVAEWVRKQWDTVVAEATQVAIQRGSHPKEHPVELDRAVEATTAWQDFLKAEAAKAERTAAKKAALAAQEKAGLDAWLATQEGETARYARAHGYGALELLIDAVDEALDRYNVVKLRADQDAYDNASWEKRKTPRAEALTLAMEVTNKLAEVGLPITSGLDGEQEPEGPHLHVAGVCRFEDEDGQKSTRVVVTLELLASPNVVWAICRDEYGAE